MDLSLYRKVNINSLTPTMKIVILFALIGSISCGLKDHARRLYVGSALSPNRLNSDARFRQLAIQNFNVVTGENEMKIDATEPQQNQFNYAGGDALVAFAQQNNMKVRGHVLVWHSQVPGWMNALSGETLLRAMDNHIANVAGHYRGKVFIWDVANEMFNEDGSLRDSIWSRTGTNFLARAFRGAHQADPNAKLYINDYNTEGINAKSNGLYNTVKNLLAQGVPIHGVGFQCHLTMGQIANNIQANLQRFADLGLDVAITELDIQTNGQSFAAQAAAYGQVISACAKVSRCVGVTIWGITDNYSWRAAGKPLPWDSNYQPKPAVTAIENALV